MHTDNLRLCVRRIVLALVKPGNFTVRAYEWRMHPMGASSSVVSHRAFQGLTRNTGKDCALFFPVIEVGHEER